MALKTPQDDAVSGVAAIADGDDAGGSYVLYKNTATTWINGISYLCATKKILLAAQSW